MGKSRQEDILFQVEMTFKFRNLLNINIKGKKVK